MPDASPIFFQRDPATGATVFEFTGRKTNSGQAEAQWAGGTNFMVLTLPHGLGQKPQSVVASCVFGFASGGGGSSTRPLVFFYQREVSDNTNIVLRVATADGSSPPAGEDFLLDWIASLGDSLVAIGGASAGTPPVFSMIAADEVTTSAAYTDLTTVGPSVTIPIAGDWILEWHAEFYTVSGAGGAAFMSPNGDANDEAVASLIVANLTHHMGRTVKKVGVAAGTTFTMKYKRGGASTASVDFLKRSLVAFKA